MIWVDYLILGIIALSALIGLARGLIREVLSLGVWVAALFLAWLFFRDLAGQLTPWVATPSVRLAVAFLMLVFGVLLAGALLGFLLTTLVEKTGLTGYDRLLGVVFGAARGGVLVALLVFVATLTPLPEDPWWQASQLIPPFHQLAERLLGLVPPEIGARLKEI
ncbi:CvpA family protein [Thiococcus pfennigii]|jgi:membrane protein required for colicin V production|uniref:CvpA family protein n=1 Tax=Thiococcus pfennigii TaxID=1057 RepID=UPI0019082490|nr:CvpA family protein [Thiococcus pfennigii]MBK1701320.1 colicin V production CvpA [Thiococcus pfennigii]MBK1732429.1 colicin V production CvpA [Thiococcus pfennigii]